MKKSELTKQVDRLTLLVGGLTERLDDQQRELERLKRVILHTQARMSSHAERAERQFAALPPRLDAANNQQLSRSHTRMRDSLETVCRRQGDHNVRLRELETIAPRLKAFVAELKEGLGGGTWRTSQGHTRFIALLSTAHLKNILLYPGASERVKGKVRSELDRREIDAKHRAKDDLLVMEFPGKITISPAPIEELKHVRCSNAPLASVERGVAQARARKFTTPRKPAKKRTTRARKA